MPDQKPVLAVIGGSGAEGSGLAVRWAKAVCEGIGTVRGVLLIPAEQLSESPPKAEQRFDHGVGLLEFGKAEQRPGYDLACTKARPSRHAARA